MSGAISPHSNTHSVKKSTGTTLPLLYLYKISNDITFTDNR